MCLDNLKNFINRSFNSIKEKLSEDIAGVKSAVIQHKKLVITFISISIIMSVVLNFNLLNLVFGVVVIGVIIPLSIYNNKILILFQLLFSMTVLAGELYIGLHGVFKLLPDIFTFIIFIKLIIMLSKKEINIKDRYILFIIALLTINIISFIFNRYNILSFIVGIRNYYVFYISFLGYIYLKINREQIKEIINCIIIFGFMQIPLTIGQYIYYIKKEVFLYQDYVAGTFGETLNGDLGFLIIIIISFIISANLYNKISKKQLILISLFAIPVILGEIKIAILVLPIVITILSLSKISKRNFKILIISIGIIGVVFAGLVFKFPEFGNMFNVKYIKYYAYDIGYGDYKLNRLSAPIYVNDEILINPVNKIFGIGVGNGTHNGADIFNSDFYKENTLLGAELFFSSLFLMENGWLGTIIFLIMIISILIKDIRLQKYSENEEDKIFAVAVKGIMVMIFISFLYSLSIFNLTMGYLIFFILGTTIRISLKNIRIGNDLKI